MRDTENTRYASDFLRDVYGAEDLRLESGGKHNKLRFNFHGRDHFYTMGRRDSGDPRVIANIRRDLKRMLGPPPASQEAGSAQPKTRRTLEELMTDLSSKIVNTYEALPPEPSKNRTWQVQISAYRTTDLLAKNIRRVYVTFPNDEVREAMGFAWFSINKLDDEHWKLSVEGDCHLGWRRANNKNKTTMISFVDDVGPFGTSDGEAVEADGEVLIYLARDKRRPVRPLRGSQQVVPHPDSDADDGVREASPAPADYKRAEREAARRSNAGTPMPVPVLPAPKPNGGVALVPMTPEERMREIVRQVREIEAASPYRLVHLADGRVIWRAPTIE